ncbi:MAG: orotidine-5'-phosphate decarboxylase [Planctomycetia bacterium]|nr:orotidine-5'-phosphate decarboxylase [Planctomycetia bacterium]
MPAFADRLSDACRKLASPVVVGLDPRFEQLPAPLTAGIDPKNRRAVAGAYAKFGCEIIDVVAKLVPAVKPQMAFYEQLGLEGMQALMQIVDHARQAGLLVILDGKRNDIGTTAEAYADGLLGADSPWGGDALTVSPYLGNDSLEPFVKTAVARDAGLFVLVKTSNPGSGQFQDREIDQSRHQGGLDLPKTLYALVAAEVERMSAETKTASGYGAVGAVVGATYPQQLTELRSAMPHTIFLVPGYGSQGGTARDCAPAFDAAGLGAVVNNSRGIIFAHSRKPYAEKFGAANWQRAVEAATTAMNDELRAETTVGKLKP